MKPHAILMAIWLSACTAQQINQATTETNAAVASAQPTIELACWLVAAADAGFQTYAASSKAHSGVVADERKAIAGANAICANPPADVSHAIADVMAAYKAVVAATPTS
jgi:hypothetical protein